MKKLFASESPALFKAQGIFAVPMYWAGSLLALLLITTCINDLPTTSCEN
jgi:hypothetical protein